MATIQAKYRALRGRLDESTLRLWAAAEARSLGRGGISAVAKAAGISRTTIHAGLAELKKAVAEPAAKRQARARIRGAGAGRKKLTTKDANLLRDLDALVEPTSRGDPMSALRWTCKSTYRLAAELNRQGHEVSQRTVCDLLGQMDYSLQSTRKTREGGQHADRDAQFAHIAKTAETRLVRSVGRVGLRLGRHCRSGVDPRADAEADRGPNRVDAGTALPRQSYRRHQSRLGDR